MAFKIAHSLGYPCHRQYDHLRIRRALTIYQRVLFRMIGPLRREEVFKPIEVINLFESEEYKAMLTHRKGKR